MKKRGIAVIMTVLAAHAASQGEVEAVKTHKTVYPPHHVLRELADGNEAAKEQLFKRMAAGQVAYETRESLQLQQLFSAEVDFNTFSSAALFVYSRSFDSVPENFVTLIREKAKNKDATAQSICGYLYIHGKGVDINVAKAAKWSRRAIDNGDGVACLSLLYLFDNRGVEADPTRDETRDHLLDLSFDNGYLGGIHYRLDEGYLLRKAAKLGRAEAELTLGKKYYDEKNYDEAEIYLQAAFDQGEEEAGQPLGDIKLRREYEKLRNEVELEEEQALELEALEEQEKGLQQLLDLMEQSNT